MSALTEVVLTHFHYDHNGTLEQLPSERFVVQPMEMGDGAKEVWN